MDDVKFFYEILKSKEDRGQKQINILGKYPYSLVSFTLNIPGNIKDSQLYRKIHKTGMIEILKAIDNLKKEIIYNEEINKTTGSEGFISVDLELFELKRLMVHIENTHPLGRIFDIDVFDKYHNQVSRSDLGLETRKCLICEKDARICMREKNHSYEDLIAKIEEISRKYIR